MRHLQWPALLAPIFALLMAGAQAQDGKTPGNGGALPQTQLDKADRSTEKFFDQLLGGIVTNRSITVLGNDFYQEFSSYWRDKDLSSRISLAIYERPTARFGSEIWIDFGQRRVFHAFLPPARAATRSISKQAVEIVYREIADIEAERLLFNSPDLGREEM
ncbi:curli production assembly/transport protein CsgE [Castellaniella sp. GW247-6E4]|uniref:curli production assembly/transport protein CsgE n=1 Tax=Castellaniella sp. GW247-6E4 TaxID=3140380 RepID=UPI003316406F